MSVIDELITTHRHDEYYGPEDLNRVGEAIKYVVPALRELGWHVQDVAPKCDWTKTDIPTEETISRFLQNFGPVVSCLRSAAPGPWPVPPSGARPWTAEEANSMEQLLIAAYDMCQRIKSSWQYSGDLIAGE